MKTIKTILTMLVALFTLAAYGQSGFPPKSYPASIKVITDPGVAQYWDVNRIMYTGPGNGGHKFRIYGKAAADSRAMNINMFYILPGNMLKPAGAYFFPAIKKGEPFSFEIVSAFTGYAPKSFQGFLIMDEMLPAPQTPPASVSVPQQHSPVSPTAIAPLNETMNDGVESTFEIRASDLEGGNKTVTKAADTPSTSPTKQQTSSSLPDWLAQAAKGPKKPYEGKVDTEAEFPGGQAGLNKWIAENLRYPEVAMENNVTGRVVVKFVVDEEGCIKDPKIMRLVDRDLEREAIRLINKMPKWKPAILNGEPVSTYMLVPFNFKLQ